MDSNRCLARSPCFSIGVRNSAVNLLRLPSRPGVSQSVERPQLLEVVLQRRPGQRQTLPRANLPDAFRDGRSRIFHRLRLVQHGDVVVVPEQRFMVPVQQRIGRDHQVVLGDCIREAMPPVGPVKHQELQVRHEARGLAPPVADQARRHHQEAREGDPILQIPVRQQGERLHGLAESHVVGKYAAEAAVGERPQPAVAGALVGAQLPAQRGGSRHFRGLGKRPEDGRRDRESPVPRSTARRSPPAPRPARTACPPRPYQRVETEQPLRLQKGLGEAREPRRVDRKPRSVLEPAVKHPAGQMYSRRQSLPAALPIRPPAGSRRVGAMIGAMSSFRPFASSERQSENQSEPRGSSEVEYATGPSSTTGGTATSRRSRHASPRRGAAEPACETKPMPDPPAASSSGIDRRRPAGRRYPLRAVQEGAAGRDRSAAIRDPRSRTASPPPVAPPRTPLPARDRAE